MKKKLFSILFGVIFLQKFAWALPNDSLRLRPGVTEKLTLANSAQFVLAGYCKSGAGDVSVTFGSLSFSVPCHPVLGVYRFEGDVSTELTTNPIYHCVTQSIFSEKCSKPVTNELAPPGLVFTPDPLNKIVPGNESDYVVSGDCAPSGASISIDIGLQLGVLTGTCSTNNKFEISGDVSSVIDASGISVQGTINDGVASVSVASTVDKSLNLSVNTLLNINLTNVLNYGLSGTCSENGRDVVISLGGVLRTPSPTCAGGLWSLSGLDLSFVPEGDVSVRVDHYDEFGNAATQVVQIIFKDTVKPDSVANILLNEGTSTDFNSPVINWDQVSDPHPSSGLVTLEMGITTNPLGGSEVSGGYADLAITDTSYTYTGAPGSFSECVDHYATFRVLDLEGNQEQTVSSSFKYDGTAPTFTGTPNFFGVGSVEKSVIIDWSHMLLSDACLGVSQIQVAIGTSLGGEDVLSFSNLPIDVETATSYRIEDGIDGFSVNFSEGVNYYVTLKFIDKIGNESVSEGGTWRIPIHRIAAGLYSTCGIDAVKDLKCWGYNLYGALGYGENRISNPSPVRIEATPEVWKQVDSGYLNSCGLSESGEVKCWGYGLQGQAGIGNLDHSYVPVTPWGLESGVSQIAVGYLHSCALKESGEVYCWGRGSNGGLGVGHGQHKTTPTKVIGISNAVQISAGYNFTCAVLKTGSMKCWGRNNYGQLGRGNRSQSTVPVDVVGVENPVHISSGFYHTCASFKDGSSKCWGRNNYGQLGIATSSYELTPVTPTGLTDVVTIEAYENHSCAILRDDSLRCWGRSNWGQLGKGDTLDSFTPVTPNGLGSNVLSLSRGARGRHTCVMMKDDKSVQCWGYNSSYRTGVSQNTSPVLEPSKLATFSKKNISKIESGILFTCALTDEGSGEGAVKCWGRGSYGVLGNGGTSTIYQQTDVLGMSSGALDLSVGYYSSCALLDDGAGAGKVQCWGRNNYGQLGDGSFVDAPTPVDVTGLSSGITEVKTHLYHACALTSSGNVQCWGYGLQGQLGHGSFLSATTPVNVTGLSGVESLAMGRYHSCAVTTSGELYCWGYNAQGQLGDGTKTSKSTPVQIIASGVKSVSLGYRHTCAVMTDDSLQCWGRNNYGELGDGGTSESLTPNPVVGMGSGVKSVAAGQHYTCTAMLDGKAYCWGRSGNYGRLGDGTILDSLLPSEILNYDANVKSIYAAPNTTGQTCITNNDGSAKCWGYHGYYTLGWGGYWRNDLNVNKAPFKPVSTFITE